MWYLTLTAAATIAASLAWRRDASTEAVSASSSLS
jgi:hypothetical protein